MTTTNTATVPCTVNGALAAIMRRARRTIATADAVIAYTTSERNPCTSPCRVVVREMTGSGFNARVKRVVWSGPIASGADAAGIAAWERVFAPKRSTVTVTAAEVASARTYANGDFDLMQHVARALTDEDRAAGREAPAYGYSAENVRRAWEMIAAAS